MALRHVIAREDKNLTCIYIFCLDLKEFTTFVESNGLESLQGKTGPTPLPLGN